MNWHDFYISSYFFKNNLSVYPVASLSPWWSGKPAAFAEPLIAVPRPVSFDEALRLTETAQTAEIRKTKSSLRNGDNIYIYSLYSYNHLIIYI